MFRECHETTAAFCDYDYSTDAAKVKQLSSFVTGTAAPYANAVTRIKSQSGLMLGLLVTAIASKYDTEEYDKYVNDGTIPAVLRRGVSAWNKRYERFWEWAIKHRLRSVFSSVASGGAVTAKTMLAMAGIPASTVTSSLPLFLSRSLRSHHSPPSPFLTHPLAC
jgi:3-methyladenine DNA glycosylase AlkC